MDGIDGLVHAAGRVLPEPVGMFTVESWDAVVDVNLRDGETGPAIAERLRRDHGVAVLFVTANPRMVEHAAPVAIGVLSKPCDEELIGASVAYALRARQGIPLLSPPAGLTLLEDRAA